MPVLPHPTLLLGDKTLIIYYLVLLRIPKVLITSSPPHGSKFPWGWGEITVKSQGGAGGKLASTSPCQGGASQTKVVGRAAAQPHRKQGQLGKLRWMPGLLVSGRGTRPKVLGLSSSTWPCGVTLGSAFSLFGSQNSSYPTSGPGELNNTTNTFRLQQYNV